MKMASTVFIDGALVLPSSVKLISFDQLPADIQEMLVGEEECIALTDTRSRTPSKLIDSDSAALLELFRTPTTIVDAVVNFSISRNMDPNAMLERAFPFLLDLVHCRLLLQAGSDSQRENNKVIPNGSAIRDYIIEQNIRDLTDVQVYKARHEDGSFAVIKLSRSNEGDALICREVHFLECASGNYSPKLLQADSFEGHQFLSIDWIDSRHLSSVCRELRFKKESGLLQLLSLCLDVISKFESMHDQNICHGDVQSSNVLISKDGEVVLIDFAFSRAVSDSCHGPETPRAGIAFYFEPEYCAALSKGSANSPTSLLGEQYSIAALIYESITGHHYLNFAIENKQMLAQICNDSPLPLPHWISHLTPELEPVLFKALQKEPQNRFSSTSEFRHSFEQAISGIKNKPSSLREKETKSRSLLKNVIERIGKVESINRTTVANAPFASTSCGAAGIALSLYQIACGRNDQELLAAADIWATRARGDTRELAFFNPKLKLTRETIGDQSLFHSVAGIYFTQVLIAIARGDTHALETSSTQFIDSCRGAYKNSDITLGRAGILLGCAILCEQMKLAGIEPGKELGHFADTHFKVLISELETHPRIGEKGSLNYLGIAHGWAGILYALLKWCRAITTNPPDSIKERCLQLTQLARKQSVGLAWVRMFGTDNNTGSEYWSGWCNGSAGFVFLWSLAHEMFRDESFLVMAKGAAEHSYNELMETGDLCCGAGGQAYSMLNLYRKTLEPIWLHRAEELTERACLLMVEENNRDSLYKGEVGLAALVQDLEYPAYSRMPLFE